MELMIIKFMLDMLTKAFEDMKEEANEKNIPLEDYYKEVGGEGEFFDEIKEVGDMISQMPEDIEGREEIFEEYEKFLENVESFQQD